MSDQLAWAAGFFDGEGSTTLAWADPKRKRDYPTLTISIGQKDRVCLDRFAAVVGLGKVYGPITQRTTAPRGDEYVTSKFHYSARGHVACEALRRIWPWLSEPKRVQALVVLDAYNASLATRRAYGGRPRVEHLEVDADGVPC